MKIIEWDTATIFYLSYWLNIDSFIFVKSSNDQKEFLQSQEIPKASRALNLLR